MRTLLILSSLLWAGCNAGLKVDSPCTVQTALSYANDQLEAIQGGCPVGVAPSGHPLTEETPFVDAKTGLPTDLEVSIQCKSPLTEAEAEQCGCLETDGDIERCFGEEY